MAEWRTAQGDRISVLAFGRQRRLRDLEAVQTDKIEQLINLVRRRLNIIVDQPKIIVPVDRFGMVLKEGKDPIPFSVIATMKPVNRMRGILRKVVIHADRKIPVASVRVRFK
jgi:hypothetical protein